MISIIGVPNTCNANMESIEKSFTDFYEVHFPRVFQYIRYRVSEYDKAEDLTASVFEKALAGFASYKPERGDISKWVITIARNTVIDYYRRNRKGREVSIEEAAMIPDVRNTPEEEAERNEEKVRLQSCLNGLSSQEREIISLKFGAEMTNRQISGILKLSESNIGTILYRAVRKMRRQFMEWDDERG